MRRVPLVAGALASAVATEGMMRFAFVVFGFAIDGP